MGLLLDQTLIRTANPARRFQTASAQGPLEHPTRRRIVELVREAPGVSPSELSRALGLRWPLVRYHVARLDRARVLGTREVAGRLALFALGPEPIAREEALALLRRPHVRRLVDALQEHPTADQELLVGLLGVSQATVSRSLKRMLGAGLVAARWTRGRQRYSLAPGPWVREAPAAAPLEQTA